MQAKMVSQNRTKLESIIPLQEPFVVYINPANICNFQCEFCTSGDHELIRKTGRKQGIMDFNLFKKLINDMCMFKNRIKIIRMHKDGEPLLNPQLPEMIKYAKQSGVTEKVEFTTNGSLLNPQLNLALIAAKLDKIHISVEAMSVEKYRAITKTNIDFGTFVENIRHFYKNRKQCIVSIKIMSNYLENGEEALFYQIFGEIADEISVERIVPCWPEYDISKIGGELTTGIYGQQIEKKEVCPHIFYSAAVNIDGSVSACCADWKYKLIVGDITQESFCDIWNGQAFRELRRIHLMKKRKNNNICCTCNNLNYVPLDNIDDFAEDLLKKI
ncbi:MoaA/NifB/PqqE/SkfB family radical SAM enzyme [Sporomusaceae bacterium BoRhaA]|uniref:radical SAM/SPASM domain-containing protein n=1 Tax=Pelorhabdus rhamnosifermentans TaxID=2772457 RepID=UPI001C064568|nr:radical SAM/SPASM domain-containing protein [Pelorhabdus rhamnosifermentans]MBU2703213.1 MoaA/NifB/PqqE/SkfB family radical SAM enzyme [Pelorhabdus rhamnosifermentans]